MKVSDYEYPVGTSYTGRGVPKRATTFEERRKMIAARAPVVRVNRALFDAHYAWLQAKKVG